MHPISSRSDRIVENRSVSTQNLRPSIHDSPYTAFKEKMNARSQLKNVRNISQNNEFKPRIRYNDFIALRNMGYLASESMGVSKMVTDTNNYY